MHLYCVVRISVHVSRIRFFTSMRIRIRILPFVKRFNELWSPVTRPLPYSRYLGHGEIPLSDLTPQLSALPTGWNFGRISPKASNNDGSFRWNFGGYFLLFSLYTLKNVSSHAKSFFFNLILNKLQYRRQAVIYDKLIFIYIPWQWWVFVVFDANLQK